MSVPTTHPIVLVVEDEESIRRVLEIGLPRFGLDARLAGSGSEALALARRLGPELAVALLDVRLPEMDGPEVLQALRAIQPELPCCFMTGASGEFSEQELLDLGATCVFQKPFALAEVVATLRALANADAESFAPTK